MNVADKPLNIEDAVAYIDSENNLRLRVIGDEGDDDYAVTLLEDGGVDLARGFYPYGARKLYYKGDTAIITF